MPRRSTVSRELVEVGPTGLAIRIFRTKKAAVLYQLRPSHGMNEPIIRQMEKFQAVGEIRRQVFKRDEYACVKCGKEVIWEAGFPNSGEMDERQARGNCVQSPDGTYQSGEVSVANCQTLCRNCHTGAGGKQDRSPSFTKSVAKVIDSIPEWGK
ncbi:Uncharacterised protein [uncultured archaeon]|nr:Uncharacterised protein [uncultured archaeon]